MKITPERLEQHLNEQLLPIYLVFGDEPLQIKEACQAIIDCAMINGFDERQVLDVGTGFDWQQLSFYAGAGSLFSQKRLIDLRIDNGKPGKEGAVALLDYLERQCSESTLLLIRMPYLNRQATNTKWFKAIQSRAGIVQIWPINLTQVPGWIQRRARAKGLILEESSVRLMAETTEGNLLATDQVLEKMLLAFGKKKVSQDEVLMLLSDDAQFDIANLIKYALLGEGRRVVQVWQHLKAMNEPQTLILWMLADTLRNLIAVSERGMDEGLRRKIRKDWVVGYQQTLKRHNGKVLYGFLQRLTVLDQAVKGVRSGDSWYALLQLSLGLAGRNIGSCADVVGDGALFRNG